MRGLKTPFFHPSKNWRGTGPPATPPPFASPLILHQNNKTRMETMTHGKLIIPIIAGIFCSDARRYLFLLTINVSKVSMLTHTSIDRSVADFVQKEVGIQNQNDMKMGNIYCILANNSMSNGSLVSLINQMHRC